MAVARVVAEEAEQSQLELVGGPPPAAGNAPAEPSPAPEAPADEPDPDDSPARDDDDVTNL